MYAYAYKHAYIFIYSHIHTYTYAYTQGPAFHSGRWACPSTQFSSCKSNIQLLQETKSRKQKPNGGRKTASGKKISTVNFLSVFLVFFVCRRSAGTVCMCVICGFLLFFCMIVCVAFCIVYWVVKRVKLLYGLCVYLRKYELA